jgi:hypothetical protein
VWGVAGHYVYRLEREAVSLFHTVARLPAHASHAQRPVIDERALSWSPRAFAIWRSIR